MDTTALKDSVGIASPGDVRADGRGKHRCRIDQQTQRRAPGVEQARPSELPESVQQSTAVQSSAAGSLGPRSGRTTPPRTSWASRPSSRLSQGHSRPRAGFPSTPPLTTQWPRSRGTNSVASNSAQSRIAGGGTRTSVRSSIATGMGSMQAGSNSARIFVRRQDARRHQLVTQRPLPGITQAASKQLVAADRPRTAPDKSARIGSIKHGRAGVDRILNVSSQ